MFSNWASYLVAAAVGFLLAPFILHRLGNTGYGIWTLVLSLTGYFGLLDLGIRSSVGRFVARYVALEDKENIQRTVSTAFVMLAAGGALALLCAFVVVRFFFGAFHVEPQFESAGKTALLITALNMALILPLGVFSSVLIALERYDIVSGITILGELARAALVVVYLKNGHGLVALASISLILTTVQYSAMLVIAKSIYAPLKLRPQFVNWPTLKEIFSFGIYRFITIVATQLISYSNAVVIGIFLGAAAITPFAIAAMLVNYGRNVVLLVTDTLLPGASRLDARADLLGLQKLLIAGTLIALMIALLFCVGVISLGKQFIVLWMGPAYASSATYLVILAGAQLSAMSQSVSVLVLSGMAKHRVLAYVALAEGLANLALSIVLVRKFGLIGVAWAALIPALISTGVVVPLYMLRTLKLGAGEYLRQAILPPFLCALPVVGIGYAFSTAIRHASWLILGLETLIICSIFGAMGTLFCLNASQRAAAVQKVWSLFQRESAVHEA